MTPEEIMTKVANKHSYETWGELMYDTHEHSQIKYTKEVMKIYELMVIEELLIQAKDRYNVILNLEKEIESIKPKRFNPITDLKTDLYYYILEGQILSTRFCNTEADLFNYKTRNCFKTKEEAEEEFERILFVNEVRDFIEEENDGWDYNNNHEDVFIISYEEGVLKYTDWDYRYKHTSDYKYFKSKEIGEKILAKFDNQKLIRFWI